MGLSELAADPDWRGETVPVGEVVELREGEPLELVVTDPASDADGDKVGVGVTVAHADHVPT